MFSVNLEEYKEQLIINNLQNINDNNNKAIDNINLEIDELSPVTSDEIENNNNSNNNENEIEIDELSPITESNEIENNNDTRKRKLSEIDGNSSKSLFQSVKDKIFFK
jgi:hypothetical protein